MEDEGKSRAELLTELKALRQELSNLKETGEPLMQEREQLLSIFDSIDEIIYVADPATHEILYVNKAVRKIFPQKLIGKTCYREFQGRTEPCDFCTTEKILQQMPLPHRWRYHNPVVNRDFVIVDRIIKWSDGRNVRFEFAQDITRQKQATEALQKGHDELEKRVKERTAELVYVNRALNESEKKLVTLLNATTDIAFLTDYKGICLAVNDALAESLGVEKEELLGREIFGFFSKETGERRNDVLQKVLLQKSPMQFEDNRDGRCFASSIYPILNDIGEVNQIAVFSKDITEGKKLARAFRESEVRYRTLYRIFRLMADNMPDMLWAKDMDRNYLFANQTLCDNLLQASSTDEPIGKNDMFFVKRARQAQAENPQWHTFGEICADSDTVVMDSCLPQRFDEYGNVKGEFLYLDVYKSPIFDEQGEMVGTVGCGRDVTRQKQIEQELRKSEQRYELATSAGQVGVWGWNLATDEVYIDPRLKALLGYKDDEIANHMDDWRRLIHPDDIRLLESKTIAHLEGVTAYYEATHRMIRKDGSVCWVLAKGTAMRDADGKPYRMVGTEFDISERKQAEDKLKIRTRELALLNSASQALVSSLDLNRVLATVLSEVQRIIGITACFVWLLEKDSGRLVCQQAVFLGGTRVPDRIMSQSSVMAEWVMQHGTSLEIADIRGDNQPFQDLEQFSDSYLRSFLCMPLRTKSGVFGVLQLADEKENSLSSDVVHMAESLTTLAAIAIDNARLYRQTKKDAKTKTLLLQEVNHRVKNNLAAITGMLCIEQNHAEKSLEHRSSSSIIKDLTNRIKGLSTVHQLLSNSNWSPLSLGELTRQVIESALQPLPAGRQVLVDVSSVVPVEVTPKDAHNLAIVINELTTNVIKYVVPSREVTKITVLIGRNEDEKTIFLQFRDNGSGFSDAVLSSEGRHVGMYLIENIVSHSRGGGVTFRNDNGAVAMVKFSAEPL